MGPDSIISDFTNAVRYGNDDLDKFISDNLIGVWSGGKG